jgi:HPt (histidine-containing phosphotransfer) domain-containing protein
MTAEGAGGDATVDLARVRAIMSTLDIDRLLKFREMLETRLANLIALLDVWPEKAGEARALAHQCHGSATTLGLVSLAGALQATEGHLQQGEADPRSREDLVRLHAEAWRLIAEHVPGLERP